MKIYRTKAKESKKANPNDKSRLVKFDITTSHRFKKSQNPPKVF